MSDTGSGQVTLEFQNEPGAVSDYLFCHFGQITPSSAAGALLQQETGIDRGPNGLLNGGLVVDPVPTLRGVWRGNLENAHLGRPQLLYCAATLAGPSVRLLPLRRRWPRPAIPTSPRQFS
jgi:hypothetical protein